MWDFLPLMLDSYRNISYLNTTNMWFCLALTVNVTVMIDLIGTLFTKEVSHLLADCYNWFTICYQLKFLLLILATASLSSPGICSERCHRPLTPTEQSMILRRMNLPWRQPGLIYRSVNKLDRLGVCFYFLAYGGGSLTSLTVLLFILKTTKQVSVSNL